MGIPGNATFWSILLSSAVTIIGPLWGHASCPTPKYALAAWNDTILQILFQSDHACFQRQEASANFSVNNTCQRLQHRHNIYW